MITIGLAGHIDHGKSSLVRRLTGIDPDRLPEEKARGMTIDLGFAHWSPEGDVDGKSEVSFVDVPGHERFVRNMIAGAGGIEAVLLVVAADDGWMPQSQEHFDIIRLLDIKRGIIAITKIDMVEPDWHQAVLDDVRDHVSGSFLENAPIVSLSSTTDEGFPLLEDALKSLACDSDFKTDIQKPRLTIDRSFTISGIGGVVTGSARGGAFELGDEVIIAPGKSTGKIRTLHRHEKQVDKVSAGQRAALSFTGIDKDALDRGAFVTTPELGDPGLGGRVLLVRIEALPDCPVKLNHRRKLLLFFGAAEIPCEIRLPGIAELKPGESACVALRCDDPPFCFAGDRFVLRLPTPQITVGGGIVLDWSPSLPEKSELKRRLAIADELFAEKHESHSSMLEDLLRLQLRIGFPQNKDSILLRSVHSSSEIQTVVKELIASEELIDNDSALFPARELTETLEAFREKIEKHFSESPHLKGLSAQEIVRLLPRANSFAVRDSLALLAVAVKHGVLMSVKGLYRLPGRELTVSGAVRKEAERMLAELQANPFAPPLIARLVTNGKVSKEALGFLFNTGEAVKVNSDLALSSNSWSDALLKIKKQVISGADLTVAWLRSELDTSRKYALPILEALDRLDVTERVGDNRIAGRKFVSFYEELE